MNSTLQFLTNEQIPNAIINLLKQCEKSFYISCFQFAFPVRIQNIYIDTIFKTLSHLSKKGIDTRVILNHKFTNPFQYSSNKATHKIFNLNKINTRLYSKQKTLHEKLIIIDDQYTIISSTNMTSNSFFYNIECGIFIQNYDINLEAKKHFLQLWERSI